ncbi:MAG TPA: STAS domain-containing protein [Terracidiphilus sp.]|nr:STAS domain-containing protein [Terracidiphilus sp.]
MAFKNRIVTVKKLPRELNVAQSRVFLRELETLIHADRPCLVLDCSSVGQMSKAGMCLLLTCLEEAMKRNGDVRLAGLTPESKVTMIASGVSHLFRMFDSNNEAVESFYPRPFSLALPEKLQDAAASVAA